MFLVTQRTPPVGSDFFHDQPRALHHQRRERQNEQRIVMQRVEQATVQQLIRCPRRAAPRTVQAGQ